MMFSLFGDTPQLCFETTHLGVLVRPLHDERLRLLPNWTLPRVETARGYTCKRSATSANAVTLIGDLPNRFDPELIRISLRAHKTPPSLP